MLTAVGRPHRFSCFESLVSEIMNRQNNNLWPPPAAGGAPPIENEPPTGQQRQPEAFG